MRLRRPAIVRKLLVGLIVASTTFVFGDEGRDDAAFFESRIHSILKTECYQCHSQGAKEIEGGLRLDSPASTLAGGDSGPAIVPGNPDASLLIQAIEYDHLEMPPDKKLPSSVIADFRKWVASGAEDPRHEPETKLQDKFDFSEAREFWAFQPVRKPTLPKIRSRSWVRTAIDVYVVSGLESEGLRPAPPASKRVLARRLYYDLLGLPPTPNQLTAFEEDDSPESYERLVDRLLASPRYGERWGQHWLDVVRYAETEGFEYDRMLPDAWRFRDYVIESLNADKPYDRFVTEQLAGDEIDASDPTLRVAAGFHRLGAVRRNAGNQKVASSRNEVLTERTDIVGTAFLGLTIGCARCHDHKFDPIPQRDYYRMQAFLAATQEENISLADDETQKHWQRATERIEEQTKKLKNKLAKQTGDEAAATRKKLEELEVRLPAPLPTLCSIKNGDEATPIHLLRRGDPGLPLEQLGMRTLGVISPDDAIESPVGTDAPRSRLAEWIADPHNPLTSRVIVNRIWLYHFGHGLVRTPNDFGANGQRPTHPQLLDFLAHQLIKAGWRMKPLHRQIVLSSVYRQASVPDNADLATTTDPENRLLSYFPRRRLSSEEIRDSMLAAVGSLNLKTSGVSVMLPVDAELVEQLYKPSQWQVTSDKPEHFRRSIYLIAKRNLRLPFMEIFDQPTAQTACARRIQSTHSPQALELLNGRISNELANEFALRLEREANSGSAAQVDLAYLLVAGRRPTDAERQLAVEFISDVSLSEFALAMFNLNAFLYVD